MKRQFHLSALIVLGAASAAACGELSRAAQQTSQPKAKPAEPTQATFLITGLH